MRVFLLCLLLSGCYPQQVTPEEQGDMIKRCEANSMDWHILDWGQIVCHKKETECVK